MSERIVGGRYCLERQLGSGGMAAVWVALDRQLRRRVAVKLLRPDRKNLRGMLARFEEEARLVARLQDLHVVQIHDYGIDQDEPYLVMELLSGEDLESRLRRLHRLPLPTVISLIAQAARGLRVAHAAGIIHRDLKPANLFLARGNDGDIVKLLDFGMAAVHADPPEETARPGVVFGTPHYMSPEQIRTAATIDPRSDLFSLGVVAYRALTGQLPFPAESLGALIVQICSPTEPIAKATSLVPGLSPAVDAFFDRALAREPAQRFQSARELAIALAALDEAGASARPTRILVVDDEPHVAALVRQRFRRQLREGVYEFVFAEDGEAALVELRRQPDIDLVLTDLNMPRMDGLTMLGHVAEINPIIKVIVVTAYGDLGNIRAAMNHGAFDFLIKPIDFQDLEKTLHKSAEQVRALRRAVRFVEENALFRLCVNSGVIERLFPMLRAPDGVVCEALDATVAYVGVRDPDAADAKTTPGQQIAVLNRYFDVILPELSACGGVVEKFLGSTAMVLFRDHGHLARALGAMLAIREALRGRREREDLPESVVIGIDAGEVVLGSIGSPAHNRMDYTVLGNVIRTAGHLRTLAAPDQILISDSLLPALGDAFECEAVGTQLLLGRTAPSGVHNVLRARPTHPASAAG